MHPAALVKDVLGQKESIQLVLRSNVCDPCMRVLKNLLNIQATATRFERFLLRPQQLVRSQSLPATKLEAR